MTTVAPVSADTPPPRRRPSPVQRYYEVHPGYRLVARWALIGVLTGVAFHRSFASLADVTRNGGIGGYVWTVPPAAVLVAVAIARRKRTELPIHDRQTDIIVAVIGLGLAVLIQGVLLPRYALYFTLLRLDLVAAWLFVTCSAVALFGLRPVIRFAWVWGMLLLVFSLPYYLAVIALGGGKTAAGAAALMIAGIGTGIAGGPSYRRGVIGSLSAWAVGFGVLAVISEVFPGAPILVFQQVPALTAICVVGVAMFYLSRRGQPKRFLERSVEPLASRQVWSGVPLVVAVAVTLSMFALPAPPTSVIYARPGSHPLAQGEPVVVPPGWAASGDIRHYPASRLYGAGAVLVRQYMSAVVGDPRWDKLARPRTIVVDTTVSRHPYSFGTYPGRVLYGLSTARISGIHAVQLGSGVTASLISVVDDDLLVTWNSLSFVWGTKQLAQRVTMFAVDNHEPYAPFPEPTQNLFPTVSTLVTLLFRGNAVLDERLPHFKDAGLLTEFGRAVVAAQTRPKK